MSYQKADPFRSLLINSAIEPIWMPKPGNLRGHTVNPLRIC